MPSFELIRYEAHEDVAQIFLNNPKSLNAMSIKMGVELLEALKHADFHARCVVISGSGRAFCSGAELSGSDVDIEAPDRDLGSGLAMPFNAMIEQIRNMSIPVITSVNGAAAGIGCSIALMGDIIIASEAAYFLQAFCNIGLVPDGGSPYLLAKSIGRVKAMELMLLGERYPASAALRDGLITRVVADDKLAGETHKLATKLAAGPTRAYAMIRRSAWTALEQSFSSQLQIERDLQRDASRTEDMVEGISAFLEKRPAKFIGR